MSKMADVKAAVDQLGVEIMSEFDAFDSKMESKLQELIAAQTTAQSSGDSAEVDAVLASIEQIRSDFRTKVQGKTDALTPQVVASAGVSNGDSLPAAPGQDTVASVDVDTIEAGQNPRLGGTVNDTQSAGGDSVGSFNQDTPSADTISSSGQDSLQFGGMNTVDASESIAGADTVDTSGNDSIKAEPNLSPSGDANSGRDTI